MTPEALLRALEAGEHSGAELAARFGVTRAAVWKAVERLRALGAPIRGAAGQGYRLEQPLELLDAETLRAALAPATASLLASLDVVLEVDSTNAALLRAAGAGAASGSVLFAERQTAGRGRRGRSWVSPLGANLYLSVLWRGARGLGAMAGLAPVAGVAVATALSALGARGVGLKWPNDLVHGGAKLGGILVEAGGELAGDCHAVIGIGLNRYLAAPLRATLDQPATDLATVFGGEPPSRTRCAAAVLDALLPALARFDAEGFAPFREIYARHDVIAGREVWLHEPEGRARATALGIAEDGSLRVRVAGRERRVHAGDVSLRACAS